MNKSIFISILLLTNLFNHNFFAMRRISSSDQIEIIKDAINQGTTIEQLREQSYKPEESFVTGRTLRADLVEGFDVALEVMRHGASDEQLSDMRLDPRIITSCKRILEGRRRRGAAPVVAAGGAPVVAAGDVEQPDSLIDVVRDIDRDDVEAEGEVEKEFILKFGDAVIGKVRESNLRKIKAIWDAVEDKLDELNGEVELTGFLKGEQEASLENLQTFIKLTLEQPVAEQPSVDELIVQLKISNRLNNQSVIALCANELINKIGTDCADSALEIVQECMIKLPKDLCDHVLKPLLVKRFAQELSPLCQVATLRHTSLVRCICRLDDTHIVSGSYDGTLRVWVHNGDDEWTCTQTLTRHTDEANCICKLDDTHIVSGSQDGTVRVWARSDDEWTCVQTLTRHTGYVECICKLDNTHFVSGSVDNLLRIWACSDDEWGCTQTLMGHNNYVNCICKLDDTHTVSGSDDSTLKVWLCSDDEWCCTQTLMGHNDYVTCVCKLDDSHIVSGSWDNTLRVWARNDDDEWICTQTLTGHTGHVYSICKLDDSHIVSGSGNNILRVWTRCDDDEWTCTQILIGHSSECICKLDNRHHVVSGSADEILKVWNLDPTSELDFEQTAFCLTLEKKFSDIKQAVQLAEGIHEHEIFGSFPHNLQKKILELGWVQE